jgi:PPK2 family polyphosphate:nucleotide phosphotransferase
MAGCIKWDSDKPCKLSKIDAGDTGGLTEEQARTRFNAVSQELGELQDLMYGAATHSLLAAFQAMDTGGKDGTIRNVMGSVNPQGCIVASFKAPTPLESAHDFLWRVHSVTPRLGQVAIFNRSHYEDVLVARVHNLVPKKIWQKRYAHIVHFENLLADANTIVLKFYLHISKDEQKTRLRKREIDPDKSWKLSLADWKERDLWDEYMKAYEDAITFTSTPHAPWFIVPADNKWYRDLIISQAIVEAMRKHKAEWHSDLVERGKVMMEEIAENRPEDVFKVKGKKHAKHPEAQPVAKDIPEPG